MQQLAQIGLILTCLLAMYVGARTLAIWRHSRKVPELAIGSNVLGIAIGGVILTALSLARGDATPTASVPYAIGMSFMVVHIAALYAGSWKIFRPGARWPLAVVVAATALACVWMVHSLLHLEATAWRGMMMIVLRDVGMAWAAFEAFRYSGMLRRRVLLGLAEPMVAHRIWLWGVGASLQIVVLTVDLVTWLATGTSVMQSATGLCLASALGLLSAGAIACAFFPPAAYSRFVSTRSTTAMANPST